MQHHLIFADGSSLGNPGRSGWGTIVVKNAKKVAEFGGHKSLSTNNEMELTALISGLEEVSQLDGDITIYTDSSYVINGASKWIHGWEKNGWVTSTKSPVQHAELWKSLKRLLDERKGKGTINYVHVPGHSGVAGNERADTIANHHAAGDEIELFEGELSDYAIDILNIDIDPGRHEQRIYDKARAKMKAYSYVSRVDGVVMTHATWAECEARVKGKRGALFQKVFSKEEEHALVAKWKK